MGQKRVFVVAWDFPPNTTAESIVAYKTLKYSENIYDICMHNDAEYQDYTYSDNLNVYRLDGDYAKWTKEAVKTFLKLDKEYKYKIINTRVMPYIGHLVGLIIKILRPGIKWMVYFSDPLWNSPYIFNKYKTKGDLIKKIFSTNILKNPNLQAFVLGSICGKIAINLADSLIFSNMYLAKFTLGKSYKRLSHKVKIIPYGYDDEMFGQAELIDKPEGKIVISHVGNIYGERNFDLIIIALNRLKNESHDLYSRILIRQVGDIDPEYKKLILKSPVYESFQFTDKVDYIKSLSYMVSSDYLLTIDAKLDKNQNMYISSKVLDYLGARKPIIAITDSSGPTAEIIKETGNMAINHNSNEMYNLLVKILNRKTSIQSFSRYENYNCQIGSKKIDEIIDYY